MSVKIRIWTFLFIWHGVFLCEVSIRKNFLRPNQDLSGIGAAVQECVWCIRGGGYYFPIYSKKTN